MRKILWFIESKHNIQISSFAETLLTNKFAINNRESYIDQSVQCPVDIFQDRVFVDGYEEKAVCLYVDVTLLFLLN